MMVINGQDSSLRQQFKAAAFLQTKIKTTAIIIIIIGRLKGMTKAMQKKMSKALKRNMEGRDDDGKLSFTSVKIIAISCIGGIGGLCNGRSVSF